MFMVIRYIKLLPMPSSTFKFAPGCVPARTITGVTTLTPTVAAKVTDVEHMKKEMQSGRHRSCA